MNFQNILLVLLVLWPTSTSPFLKVFAVWNVGQGLWTTWSEPDLCLHIDMGGEKNQSFAKSLCRQKKNPLIVTHFDRDHTSFIKSQTLFLANMCLLRSPLAPSKLKLPKSCENSQKGLVQEIQNVSPKKTSNDQSLVHVLGNLVLVSGDSDQKQESNWAKNVSPTVKYLVLGHHGSRTSTSEKLLDHLPNLKIAIASARKKKYGHPHFEVLMRLKARGVSVLETEKWGTIFLEAYTQVPNL